MQRVPKLNYRQVRFNLQQRSKQFFYMQEDQDFKAMYPKQALELIIFFLSEAFDLPRESLVQNKQNSSGIRQEIRDSTLTLLNANLLFYKGLAMLN